MADIFVWSRERSSNGDMHPVLGSLRRRITVEKEKSFAEHLAEDEMKAVSPVAIPDGSGGVRVLGSDLVLACPGPLGNNVKIPHDLPPYPSQEKT